MCSSTVLSNCVLWRVVCNHVTCCLVTSVSKQYPNSVLIRMRGSLKYYACKTVHDDCWQTLWSFYQFLITCQTLFMRRFCAKLRESGRFQKMQNLPICPLLHPCGDTLSPKSDICHPLVQNPASTLHTSYVTVITVVQMTPCSQLNRRFFSLSSSIEH